MEPPRGGARWNRRCGQPDDGPPGRPSGRRCCRFRRPDGPWHWSGAAVGPALAASPLPGAAVAAAIAVAVASTVAVGAGAVLAGAVAAAGAVGASAVLVGAVLAGGDADADACADDLVGADAIGPVASGFGRESGGRRRDPRIVRWHDRYDEHFDGSNGSGPLAARLHRARARCGHPDCHRDPDRPCAGRRGRGLAASGPALARATSVTACGRDLAVPGSATQLPSRSSATIRRWIWFVPS